MESLDVISENPVSIDDIFQDIFKDYDDAIKKLPKVLSKLKKRFLMVINKSTEESFSEEDEQMVKDVTERLRFPTRISKLLRPNIYCSLQWDDSKASTQVKALVQEHGLFQLSKYLDCAHTVFLCYSGTILDKHYKAMEYVLIHARQFEDPEKTVFLIDEGQSLQNQQNEDVPGKAVVMPPLPNSKFMKRVSELIYELRLEYNDSKYRILNVNATYLTLLTLRRIVKKEAEFSAALKRIHTHDSYVRLCPWPLDKLLPTCDTSNIIETFLKGCAYLAIEAYLNTNDEKTKRVLRTTCIQYMKWNGLQLPNLFFKVVELYDIDAGRLWDLLSYKNMAVALINLEKEYHKQYEMLKADPTQSQRWFPYCRVLDGDYHRNLSVKSNMENTRICAVLAYLVDLKIGYDKSTIRFSHWVKSASFRKECEQLAKEISKSLIE